MADFSRQDLSSSRFERVDLEGARFRAVDLSRTDFAGVLAHHVRMRGIELLDVEVHGELLGVRINGVDVAPLVEAELDRCHPERAAMRATDPAGSRHA